MNEQFLPIIQAFEKAGVNIANAGYSITQYSLNTSLSFKFSNLKEFILFLGLSEPGDNSKIQQIVKMLTEAGVADGDFFYVNFYKPKIAEL